jgi:hypothetical protein
MTLAASLGAAKSQTPAGAKPWKATVTVVDESGQAVPGAKVTVGYYAEPKGSQTISLSSNKGVTDTNGVFVTSGQTRSTDLFIGVSKEGFYHSQLQYELGLPIQYDAQKWSPSVTLTLKKVGHPIPMYAKKVETKLAKDNERLGFDLAVGDWVQPFGAGKSTDLIFTVTRHVKSDTEYEADLNLTFPNKGDGIAVIPAEPKSGSDLRLPPTAPDSGYESHRSWHYTQIERPAPVAGYFYRVHTVTDELGNVKTAQYGKISGDLALYVGTRAPRAGIGFTYYLNPSPNDRNVEFDPQKNLLRNIAFDQTVKEP